MRASALFGAKTFRFFEIYDVFTQTKGRGIEPVQTFCGQGGEVVNFSRFCADILYGRPLMKKSVKQVQIIQYLVMFVINSC